MTKTGKKQSLTLGMVIAVCAAVMTTGGITAWFAWKSLNVAPDVIHEPINNPPTDPDVKPPLTEAREVSLYWLNTQSNDLDLIPVPVTIDVQDNQTPQETLTATLQLLLQGPQNSEYTTTIPKQTELLNLVIKEDGIHINLSEAFAVGGGSADMTARLGQIIYTSTSLDPNVKVWIDVEGKPLEFLGGEGLIIDQPMTRKDFEDNFPLKPTE